jgi:hypothetical protein
MTASYNMVNENIQKIFIHEITGFSKIINRIRLVKFGSMGSSSEDAVQQIYILQSCLKK